MSKHISLVFPLSPHHAQFWEVANKNHNSHKTTMLVGRYGDTCSSECQTANCQQCDQKTGAECTQCTLFRQPPACTDCLDGHHKQSDSSGCLRCTWSCKSGTVCDKTTGHCESCPPGKQGNYCQQDISDGGDKETVNTTALIGSVIGGALIIGICVIILGIIILKRRSARSEGTRQNNQASNDLNLSPTSPRPEAPGDREERTTVFQVEPIYEIADDRAKATKPSAISDTMYQQSEADSANPYDLPTEQYHNTGDVHLYDHWSDSRAPQQDAQTARAGGSGGKGKAAKQHTPRP
ncbi:hypothetical protein ACOMHN_062697 [Nucella lapillus]